MKNLVISNLPNFLKPYWVKLQASPLGYRLAKGTFWSVVGTLLSRGLALLASIVVARVVGKVGFGELGIIQSTVGMLGIFAGLGMGLTANKHVAEFKAARPDRAGRIIALSSLVAWLSGLLLSCILLILAPWLAKHTLAAPHLTPLLRAGSLILLFSSINGAQTGALAGFEAFKRIASVNLYSGLANFPLVVAGVLWKGLEGAVWGLVCSQALGCLFSFFAIRAEALKARVPLTFSGCWSEKGLLWSFSLPAVLGGAVVGPVFWACSAMVANEPNGYAEMGLYNAANQWRAAIQFLPGMIAMAALPMLSSLQNPEDAARFSKLLRVNLLMSFAISAAVAIPVILFSPWIMAAYGKGFASGAFVLSILAVVTVITATLNMIGQAITSLGKMWAGFVLNAIWAVAMLLAAVCLKEYGAVGLAGATLLAYIVHAITSTFYFRYALGRRVAPWRRAPTDGTA